MMTGVLRRVLAPLRTGLSSTAAPAKLRAPVLAVALGCVAATAGCGVLPARAGSDGDEGTSSTSAVDTGLVTVSWGVFDGMASVLVRNDTDEVLRRADAIVRVLDQQDITLATSASMPEQGQCCSAMNVPPGGTYGFYFSVGDRGDQIDHVLVDYSDLAWSADDDGPTVLGEPVDLSSDDTGAVAVVDLVTTGGPVDKAVVQARLDDADGNFLAVVSARWACLTPERPTRAELQLFHAVPPGTTLTSAEVYPVTAGAADDGTGPDAACTG